MDFGRAYFSYISIRDAAQEGAAYASIAPADTTGILGRVRDTSSNPIDLSSFGDDQIDIVGTFTVGPRRIVVITLFQGVKILAMGKNLSPYRIVPDAGTVTIALRPEDIKMLSYVLDSGNKIRLTLRAPLDPSKDLYSAVSAETLMKRLGMWAPAPREEAKPKLKIYKGPQDD